MVKFQANSILQVIRMIAEVTHTKKNLQLKDVLREIRNQDEGDSFDYIGFDNDGREYDCTVRACYYKGHGWFIEIE